MQGLVLDASAPLYGRAAGRQVLWESLRQALFAETWEELCRNSVPFFSSNRKRLILGEVKWRDTAAASGRLQDAYRGLVRNGIPELNTRSLFLKSTNPSNRTVSIILLMLKMFWPLYINGENFKEKRLS